MVKDNVQYYNRLKRTINRLDLVVIDERAFYEAGRGAVNPLVVDHAYWMNPNAGVLRLIIQYRMRRR